MRPRTAYPIVLLLALAATPLLAQRTLEDRAQNLEGKVMAPCCGANTVAEHHSAASEKVRQEIREALAAGKTDHEVLEMLVAEYGEPILAAPRPEGFNLVPYLVPFALLIGGGAVLVLVVRGWARRERDAAVDAPAPAPDVPEEYLRRLREDLASRD